MEVTQDPLAAEKTYLRSHRDELSKRYPGHYLLIKGEAVVGAFGSFDQAVEEGVSRYGAGPFLVQSADQPDDESPVTVPVLLLVYRPANKCR